MERIWYNKSLDETVVLDDQNSTYQATVTALGPGFVEMTPPTADTSTPDFTALNSAMASLASAVASVKSACDALQMPKASS